MKKITSLLLLCALVFSCKNNTENNATTAENESSTDTIMEVQPGIKISLAQWSMHKMVEDEGRDPFEFTKEAKALGFDAVEYVSQLYDNKIKELGFQAVVDSLKARSEKYGVKCVLIMVDGEGDLADPDEAKRNLAVENHKKWVDAAERLGGHAIRVNTFGTNDPEIWIEVVQDGLKKLSEYAATKNINVLVENHGWMSSNAPLVMEAIKGVNMANCGTLPDFGNWCVKRANDERWGECIEEYPDHYEGIRLMMPTAKAVSAKSYDFDANGNQPKIDYVKMIQIVKDAGYDGYIGIEYEGSNLSEKDGIIATRDLLLKADAQTN